MVPIVQAVNIVACMWLFISYIFISRDWYPVWAGIGYWESTVDNSRYFCTFEIQYSPNRRSYRLKCKGVSPTHHEMYLTAVETLNEYIKEHI